MSKRPAVGNPALLRRVREEIERRGPMPFSRFMELALYDPEHGYYASGPDRLGRGGDYYTASDVGPAFGRCLARQLAEMDRLLGSPDPFTVVEFGAGRGLLARDIIDAMSDVDAALAGRLRLVLVDRSPAMREACRGSVPQAQVLTLS